MRGTKPKHPAVTISFPLWPHCHIVTFNSYIVILNLVLLVDMRDSLYTVAKWKATTIGSSTG